MDGAIGSVFTLAEISRMIIGKMHFIDFGIVSSPRIAENPITSIVLVIHLDLAINGARCKAITIVVESGCRDHVSVAMIQELERVGEVVEGIIIFPLRGHRLLLCWDGLFRCWCHCSFYGGRNGWRRRRMGGEAG